MEKYIPESFLRYKKWLLLVPYLTVALFAWYQRDTAYQHIPSLLRETLLGDMLLDMVFAALALVGLVCLVQLLRYPIFEKKRFQKAFERVGLHNKMNEYPALISKQADRHKQHGAIYALKNFGISMADFDNKNAQLEAALDMTIYQLEYGKKAQTTLLYAIPRNDFRKFNMRLAYYIRKNELPPYEYIVAIEPQARGSLHAHLLLIFQKKAPFIPNSDLAKIWGHGFVKIKALKNVDNIGAYLSAYLDDMELGEALAASSGGNSFKVVDSTGEDGKRQAKAIVKGARLKLYPKGFRLFRKSRGIVPPIIKDCTNAEAMREIGGAALTYEKTIRLVTDDGKTCNVINYRHYNKKRRAGGVPDGKSP